MGTTTVMEYAPPAMEVSEEQGVLAENEVAVFVAAIGWVVLIFGGAWAYCKAVCGWRGVRECSTSWLQVKAVCKV